MSVKNFVDQWSGRGYEKGEAQPFWMSFLREFFNITAPEKFISFEVPVPQGFIDALIEDTKVLIEQKSSSVNLDDPEIFLQAKRYNDALEYSRKARWIVTCNFNEFRIFDMDRRKPQLEPLKIFLHELPEKFHAFDFMIDPTKVRNIVELELSLKAGEIVGKLYDALLTQYINPNSAESQISLNKLCVRLVFCLYAESSDLFGKHKIFRDYLNREHNLRRGLIDLFEVLSTPLDKRDPYLDDMLKKFPYVNGGLFEGEIEIPNFTPEIKTLLLEEASSNFNWSGISPTIFGAVFESTLNPETRRAGGMHYTSLENIHKVINPLFMDDLRTEFAAIKNRKQLRAFHDKLAAIKIFDPACGSGNFLTESYLCLRRLENEVLKKILGSQITLGELDNPVKVSIAQFYGIEINDFAVAVAQTALWIAELQMIQETQQIIHRDLDFFPLKSYSNIREANALHVDWQTVVPEANYIIGNPPFVGARLMNATQKSDLQKVFDNLKGAGNLDYVAAWFKKAADFSRQNNFRAAFVATNSLCQGDSVGLLWKNLFAAGIHIDFAYRTFRWDSESAQKAHVHCVIVGFSTAPNLKPKILFDGDNKIIAQNINGYLLDAPNIFVDSRPTHLQPGIPEIGIGNKPIDDGNYLFTFDEMNDFIKREPAAKKYFYPWYGAREFINNAPRYCLLLKDCPPNELRKMPLVYQRVKNVRDYRLASKSAATRKLADKPTRFHVENFPKGNYLAIPKTSSEKRFYIPIGFMDDSVVCADSLRLVSNAEIYYFGILTSSIHMAWMRTVGGRLKSDYSYSNNIVYNNFIWPEVSERQRQSIEQSAQKILDVRAKYPDATFADLYDEVTMPSDLRAAHRANDRAVAAAYGLENLLDDEPALVIELLKLYEAWK